MSEPDTTLDPTVEGSLAWHHTNHHRGQWNACWSGKCKRFMRAHGIELAAPHIDAGIRKSDFEKLANERDALLAEVERLRREQSVELANAEARADTLAEQVARLEANQLPGKELPNMDGYDIAARAAYKAGAAAVIAELRAHFDQHPEIISRADLFEALDVCDERFPVVDRVREEDVYRVSARADDGHDGPR